MTIYKRIIQMLGKDHIQYGIYSSKIIEGNTSLAAMSVGADRKSPSLRYKGDKRMPNEDALLLYDDHRFVLHAIADAHFGHSSSHQLIQGLASSLPNTLPSNIDELKRFLRSIRHPPMSCASRTTLMISIFDRKRMEGFGISIGDSSQFLVSQMVRRLNPHTHRYISPRQLSSLDVHEDETFVFEGNPDSLLVSCSDGVDECHYRAPEKSIRPKHQ
ncbi:MAG: hypothetical protein VX278_13460, partial [Myxococcota bacterium]|nr:hypothetical protein [Myxococcota bacterium]